jgi:hypothetical protein
LQEGSLKLKSEDLSNQEQAINVQKADMALQLQKRYLAALQGAKPGQGSGAPSDAIGDHVSQLAGQMDEYGQLALQAGMPEQAKEYLGTASTLRKNQASTQKLQDDEHEKNINLITSLLDNVHDQHSWQQANSMAEMETGHQSPFKNTPYSPELVENLKQSYQSHKDKMQAAAAQARTKASMAEVQERETRLGLIKAQTKVADDRAKKLEKEGGAGQLPKKDDVDAATELVMHDYGDLSPSDAKMMARPVADRMMQLMQSGGLGRAEAAKKAYAEARQQGQFEGLSITKQESGTASRPIPFKAGATEKDLKVNKYYINASGQVGYWDGKMFRTPKLDVDEPATGEHEDPDEDADE